ncbi:MAG TPA: hypothetical protein VMB80_03170 [Candidatus Acidoferrum sp.]|nr:hypothetical protein [Candidatus Acidoferrum sp.]
MQPADNKLLIISFRTGRLGNRLALFANIIGFAAEHGYRVINPAFHSYAHLFENTRRDIYCRYPVAQRRSLLDLIPGVAPALRKTRLFYQGVRHLSGFISRFPVLGQRALVIREIPRQIIGLDTPEVQTRLANARIVFVHGWRIRAPESVRRHAGLIRDFFRPRETYELAGRRAVERLRQNADIVAGVHVRLGDNWKWRGGRYYFPVSQYVTWMRELAGQFPGRKVSFLICSDEPRNAAEFPGLTVGLGPGSVVGDLDALARCDYIMGAPSTYTQWASFYGNHPLLFLESTDQRIVLDQFQVSDLQTIP